MDGALLERFCQDVVDREGSDAHFAVGATPRARIHGRLHTLSTEPLSGDDVTQFLGTVLHRAQLHRFQKCGEVDAAFVSQSGARFRLHAYQQGGQPAVALRLIPTRIPTFEDLGLSTVFETLVRKPQGLLLVVGPTGSGKSTTLAAMVDAINRRRAVHIVTLEDPIEFVHSHRKAFITQQVIGVDFPDLQTGAKNVLRQDPDVVCLGELRDLDAVRTAMTIAETGHLTLATLHTNSAMQTLNRLVSMYPVHQQGDIRTQLAMVLEGIVSQRLLPRVDEKGRVAAVEVLVPTPAVRNLIREDKIPQIYSMMQTGQAKHGMQTMNQALLDLCRLRVVATDVAMGVSSAPEELGRMLDRAGGDRVGGTPVARLRSR